MATEHKIDRCKGCNAEIIWIKDQCGTKLPVNKTRVRTYWIYGPDEASFAVADGKNKPELVYISHFVTCPNVRADHRRGIESGHGGT